jgi:hypothetical protein
LWKPEHDRTAGPAVGAATKSSIELVPRFVPVFQRIVSERRTTSGNLGPNDVLSPNSLPTASRSLADLDELRRLIVANINVKLGAKALPRGFSSGPDFAL